MTAALLEVRDLVVEFATRSGVVRAVDGVTFFLPAGGSLGIVGESGSGKSMTALAILRLIPDPPGRIAAGDIVFQNTNLLQIPIDAMPDIRGRDIGMVFQEPMSSLNPVMRVGDQVAESVLLHHQGSRAQSRARAIEMLGLVGIPAPSAERADAFPHQLSGGMRQRVMIAMALACRPKLLIADEPTTALDVTIQAQVLDLMKRLRQTLGTAILLISHDLGVIADIAERVVVMYGGRIMESADTGTLFRAPRHPYTRGLLESIPRLHDERHRLHQIPGTVPPAGPPRAGCPFAPRCDLRRPVCTERTPPATPVADGHFAACWAVAEEVHPA